MTELPRLLIIDDDPGVLILLTRLLGDSYAITACPDGRQALGLLHEHPFDLVVTDLRLPDVTGLDILNAARALPDAPAVIIVTGYATLDTAIQATNDGASAYLPKPLNLEHFRGTVSRILERRQLERALQESEHRYRQLYQQAQQRVQELQLLFEASQLLNQPFDAPAISQQIGHILGRLFSRPDQQANLVLFEDETDALTYAGSLPETTEKPWLYLATPCPADCPVRQGHPLLRDMPPPAVCPLYDPARPARLCVPVQIGERIIGVLHGQAATSFAEGDERLLATLAGQVAAALEGLGTVRQRERLAVLEERDRMARALHDGLAQRFSYLGLAVDGLVNLLDAGRLDEARQDLLRLRQAVDEGQQEIRQAIAGLRHPSRADAGSLSAELAALVRHWGREHQIATRFRCNTPSSLRLSPVQAEHLQGIVQEALHNVAKHAQAQQVEVTITSRGAENLLTIRDDGVGFNPRLHLGSSPGMGEEGREGEHLGLIILEERAALLGGHLTVDSAPGRGTRIIVTWPAQTDRQRSG